MRIAWLAALVLGSWLTPFTLTAGTEDPEINVNSRYTVETVIVRGDGWSTNLASDHDEKISSGLREEISALIGKKLNVSRLDDLGSRLRKEFQARAVTHRVQRGDAPESVRVVFQIVQRPARFDVSVPKFLYASKQGWSGEAEGTATIGHNGFTFGLASDGDELVERYTGLLARYENTRLGTDRVHLRFEFESYHDNWNGASRVALAEGVPGTEETSGIYRNRMNLEPMVVFVVARPLTLSVGASFQRMQEEEPGMPIDAANAFVTKLQYQWHTEDAQNRQDVAAGYSLHAGTRALGSDFVYGRQHFEARYRLTRGKQVFTDEVQGGWLTGRAPLFERYVAGNSTLLRGWNRYEIDPFGGNRIIHNSVDYRYGIFQVFYDTGAVWDRGQPAIARHSVGVGLRQSAFFLAIAFPVREGRADPMFLVGMNY
ncbi:MAG TPA: BamA/TamA family outer membrane protein [Bryobacteraceae bacterium]|nr:BamA/TamA family outer membrane protein [Bryobacteraceae bacterium]